RLCSSAEPPELAKHRSSTSRATSANARSWRRASTVTGPQESPLLRIQPSIRSRRLADPSRPLRKACFTPHPSASRVAAEAPLGGEPLPRELRVLGDELASTVIGLRQRQLRAVVPKAITENACVFRHEMNCTHGIDRLDAVHSLALCVDAHCLLQAESRGQERLGPAPEKANRIPTGQSPDPWRVERARLLDEEPL